MKTKKPNIFAFRTAGNNSYIYDACTNRVFPAPSPVHEIAELYGEYNKDDIIAKFKDSFGIDKCTDAYNQIDKWARADKAFFDYDETVNDFSYTEQDMLNSFRNNSSPHIILGITEDCNFRCNYCVYSGQYKNFRTHARQYMSFETARKALDYFLTEVADPDKSEIIQEQTTISFYGGEALLAFNTMKEIISYVKNKYIGRRFDFRMTSNGYLLNDSIIDFLYENNVGIAVSLDGPAEDHDRNRVLAGGEKTFDRVFHNILRIREKYPEYYKKKIMLQVSYDWKSDLTRISKFFNSNEDILPKGKTFSQINSKDTEYYKRFSSDDREAHINRVKKLKKEYFAFLSDSGAKDKPGVDAIFRGPLYKLSCRPYSKRTAYTGICSPCTRLFVSVDGAFHICERINDTFPIGNCDTGLDFDKIYRIRQNFYNAVIKEGNCNTCIARQYCPVCFVTAAGPGTFSIDGICESTRRAFKEDIAEYYTLLENNPELVKKFLTDASFLELR